MSPTAALDNETGAKTLSLDSGSIASLMSSITVIEELMRRVQKESDSPELPRPVKHFGLMVGAGFAGLLVIMFGRLGMSVEEAKMHISTIVRDTFAEKKWSSISVRFKATKLEAAVKNMLEECGAGVNARMMDARASNSEGCKVMVCVAPESAMQAGVPVCLRTYHSDRNSVPDCTIVEAVRATCAVAGMFKPAAITEPGGITVSYVGLGGRNPTGQLLDEAAHIFRSGHMSCVVSIGAGQAEASDCELMAQEMSVRFEETPRIYFRFGVDRGMQDIRTADWAKLSDAVSHARSYLSLVENNKRISELAQALTGQKSVVPTTALRGAVPAAAASNHKIKECPPPSLLFVGRELQLAQMKRCLVNGSEERHVCVLHGLGGAGKTQLALKFAQLYKSEHQHIFYVDATSDTTIDADLKNIALAKNVGDNSSDTLTWLAHLPENWLVVYNNADNPSLNLRRHFPACSHGNILITTRNRRMINLAHSVEAECHVSEMSEEDAQNLLTKAVGATREVGSSGLTVTTSVVERSKVLGVALYSDGNR